MCFSKVERNFLLFLPGSLVQNDSAGQRPVGLPVEQARIGLTRATDFHEVVRDDDWRSLVDQENKFPAIAPGGTQFAADYGMVITEWAQCQAGPSFGICPELIEAPA